MLIKTAINHGNAITLGPVVRDGVTAQFFSSKDFQLSIFVFSHTVEEAKCSLTEDYVFC